MCVRCVGWVHVDLLRKSRAVRPRTLSLIEAGTSDVNLSRTSYMCDYIHGQFSGPFCPCGRLHATPSPQLSLSTIQHGGSGGGGWGRTEASEVESLIEPQPEDEDKRTESRTRLSNSRIFGSCSLLSLASSPSHPAFEVSRTPPSEFLRPK